ncbi:hypothetical protein [Bartonella sp. 1-1C]|uniref:hypothetical protein n=1 Tax=Bartonella sp. 1-1C TaxID=515256 RepID=UPI0001F4CAFB|nr:hypothetical protein [Bartonella sp. 1-1C]ATO56906.1 hypothetical protein B11Cv2_001190 [Bartonella sp. 1-1C]ATO57170.1 hypothetical protein B11Cv2_003880 [Bartonella sp. 1-1C]CBI80334.1 hypothetical protein B11C_100001 [Bartonella sp. 1-1C]
MINEPQISITKVQLIDLVNKIGEGDIYYGVLSHQDACFGISIDPLSKAALVYMLNSIFARDDRKYFPLLPHDDFNQWFSSVFTQAFTTWMDNYFAHEFSSFYRLNGLILFMGSVESKLGFLRDKLIEKRKEEIKLINDVCSMCLN